MINLDPEEREILEAYEAGELKPVRDKEAELQRHQEYATAAFKKDQTPHAPLFTPLSRLIDAFHTFFLSRPGKAAA